MNDITITKSLLSHQDSDEDEEEGEDRNKNENRDDNQNGTVSGSGSGSGSGIVSVINSSVIPVLDSRRSLHGNNESVLVRKAGGGRDGEVQVIAQSIGLRNDHILNKVKESEELRGEVQDIIPTKTEEVNMNLEEEKRIDTGRPIVTLPRPHQPTATGVPGSLIPGDRKSVV